MSTTHQNFCSNNCEFAKKLQLLSYTAKYGDDYIDADYLWRCTKIDQIITTDSDIIKLGCATFSSVQPAGSSSPLVEIVQVASAIEKLEDQIAAIGTATASPPPVESEQKPAYTAEISASPTPVETHTSPSKEPSDVPITRVIVVTPEKVVEIPEVPVVKERKKPGRKPKVKPEDQVKAVVDIPAYDETFTTTGAQLPTGDLL